MIIDKFVITSAHDIRDRINEIKNKNMLYSKIDYTFVWNENRSLKWNKEQTDKYNEETAKINKRIQRDIEQSYKNLEKEIAKFIKEDIEYNSRVKIDIKQCLQIWRFLVSRYKQNAWAEVAEINSFIEKFFTKKHIR